MASAPLACRDWPAGNSIQYPTSVRAVATCLHPEDRTAGWGGGEGELGLLIVSATAYDDLGPRYEAGRWERRDFARRILDDDEK